MVSLTREQVNARSEHGGSKARHLLTPVSRPRNPSLLPPAVFDTSDFPYPQHYFLLHGSLRTQHGEFSVRSSQPQFSAEATVSEAASYYTIRLPPLHDTTRCTPRLPALFLRKVSIPASHLRPQLTTTISGFYGIRTTLGI